MGGQRCLSLPEYPSASEIYFLSVVNADSTTAQIQALQRAETGSTLPVQESSVWGPGEDPFQLK